MAWVVLAQISKRVSPEFAIAAENSCVIAVEISCWRMARSVLLLFTQLYVANFPFFYFSSH